MFKAMRRGRVLTEASGGVEGGTGGGRRPFAWGGFVVMAVGYSSNSLKEL